MKISTGRIKKYILKIFFLFLEGFLLASENTADSSGEARALSYLRGLCFEITRYNMTGISVNPESAKLAELSKVGTRLMSRRKVLDSVQNPVYLCEYYVPSARGIIDSTFCPKDLVVTEDFFSGIAQVEGGTSGEEEQIPEFDWIDFLLQGLGASQGENASSSEYFGILDGEKILEMLENNESRGIDVPNGGKNTAELPPEFTYARNDGSLRRFSYDGEQFTVWNEGEDTVLVNFYGDKLVRKTFDSLYRLVKNERFKLGKSAKKVSLETKSLYAYAGENVLPERVIEELSSAQKRSERHFDKSGRLVSLLESHYEMRESKKSEKKSEENAPEVQLLNDKQTSKRYDSKGRLAEEENRSWSYKTNSFGRRIVEVRSTRTVYEYGEDESLAPDMFFYEDGELHLVRKYKSQDSYSETLYFDGGFSVELVYESGIKKTEIIYMNGVEQRRRNFEY